MENKKRKRHTVFVCSTCLNSPQMRERKEWYSRGMNLFLSFTCATGRQAAMLAQIVSTDYNRNTFLCSSIYCPYYPGWLINRQIYWCFDWHHECSVQRESLTFNASHQLAKKNTASWSWTISTKNGCRANSCTWKAWSAWPQKQAYLIVKFTEGHLWH